MGNIYEIDTKNYSFMNNCSTFSGATGGPIFNVENYKIIGIQNGIMDYRGNYGIFLKLKKNQKHSIKPMKRK